MQEANTKQNYCAKRLHSYAVNIMLSVSQSETGAEAACQTGHAKGEGPEF